MSSSEKIKVSARPPVKSNLDDLTLDAAMNFIRNDTPSPMTPPQKQNYPWEKAREDVLKTFNLRLPEEYALKLEFLSERTGSSKHEICIAAVRREIDQLIKEHV
jgi:hypothetical protein